MSIDLSEHVAKYETFVDSLSPRIPLRHSLSSSPMEMELLHAIGKVTKAEHKVNTLFDVHSKTRTRRSREFTTTLEDQAEKALSGSFLTHALLYKFVSESIAGKEVPAIKESLQNFFNLHQGANTPFMLYHVDRTGLDTTKDALYFLLDWDGTLETSSDLRKHTVEFLRHFDRLNKDLVRNKYRMIITSASFGVDQKVSRYLEQHPDLLDLIDAIYSVPVIMRQPTAKGERAVFGKLYTGLCQDLHIPYNQAVVLTDHWSDKSVENTHPINTLVTPAKISAKQWIHAVEVIERKTNSNIADGFSDTKTSPGYFVEVPFPGKDETSDAVRVYPIGNNLYMMRSTKHSDCFFINNGPVPLDMPKSLIKQFQDMYKKVGRRQH